MRFIIVSLAMLYFWAIDLSLASQEKIPQEEIKPEDVQKAIDRGCSFLKTKKWDKTTEWRTLGECALANWTLLEMGESEKDPMIAKSAEIVREGILGVSETYTIVLAMLFLEKLGDPRDRPLLQFLGYRLMLGQTKSGGWSYRVPIFPNETAVAQKFLDDANLSRKTNNPGPFVKIQDQHPLSLLTRQKVQEYSLGKFPALSNDSYGDNSNTQFAIIGLWLARRHGVPVGPCFLKVDQRFRISQAPAPNGGWAYDDNDSFRNPTMSMTCAALFGLILAQGALNPKGVPKDFIKDPVVERGFQALGEGLAPKEGSKIRFFDNEHHLFYLYFCLERVGVVYDLKTIGTTDWYTWGAKKILDTQDPGQGYWNQKLVLGLVPDTCFALLFLKRVNVAHDLNPQPVQVAKKPENKEPMIKKEPEKVPIPAEEVKPDFKDLIPKGGLQGHRPVHPFSRFSSFETRLHELQRRIQKGKKAGEWAFPESQVFVFHS